MPGNPNYVVPFENYGFSLGGSSSTSPKPQPYKTLEEIATDNKKKGGNKFDFQDVLEVLEGKKDSSLSSM